MTDVKKDNTAKISSVAQARALYAPAPASYLNRMGVEVETALYKAEAGAIAIPTPQDMLDIQQWLKARGYDAQLEAAGVLEYASPSAAMGDVAPLVAQVKKDLAVFAATAKQAGFETAPYSILPTTTREEAFNKMASRERLVTSINAMLDIFPAATVEIPLLTAGVQVSFSPRDNDDLFDMTRRAYALTPLLLAATNPSAGFVKGEDKALDYAYRMNLYAGYGAAGGISPAFARASSGGEFIDNHINAVFDAPMHFAYGADGTLFPASAQKPITFRALMEEGLNTQSNYELAESFLYNDIKICNLRDESGAVIGKRMEVRAADSGAQQPAMALLLVAGLVPQGPMAAAFDALCAAYGFSGNPVQDAELLAASRQAAVFHKGKFMDVAFGTGRMMDFAAGVADILQQGYAGRGVEAELAQLTQVLRTGDCDARLNAQAFATLDDARRALVNGRGAAGGKTPPAGRRLPCSAP